MLVYYFVPFFVSNRYLLFWVSNGPNSVTVQNRTHVYMNFFDHKDLGNHLLHLCPKVVKHPVFCLCGPCLKKCKTVRTVWTDLYGSVQGIFRYLLFVGLDVWSDMRKECQPTAAVDCVAVLPVFGRSWVKISTQTLTHDLGYVGLLRPAGGVLE